MTTALLALLVVMQAPTRTIAITIDDVPWTGDVDKASARRARTAQMIDALRAHAAPAAIFVNCGRLQTPDPLLALWTRSGATIGNHTTHHRNLNTAPLNEWLNDVRTCDAALRKATGRPVRFFRFPFLHEGENAQQMNAARAVLRELGYRNGHVTIDNSDIALVRPYAEAIARGDSGQARRLAAAALAHDLDATRHFEDVARRKVGRDVAHIILLHANAMTAAIMSPLLDSLQHRRYKFVSLETALADPVYQRPTCYVGQQGFSFLYRIAPCTAGQDAWDLAAQKKLH